MPLLASTLASGLSSVFTGVDSYQAAGTAWSNAYDVYARTAVAAGAPAILTGLEKTVMARSLAGVFEAGVASQGSSTLASMEAAFAAFWMLPPVVFGAGFVSAAPPGLAGLISATVPLNIVAATSAEAASNIANAIHTWTLSITVTFPNGATVTLI